jgi:hypothetical protein
MNALCFSGFVREEQLVVLHEDFPFEVLVANVTTRDTCVTQTTNCRDMTKLVLVSSEVVCI